MLVKLDDNGALVYLPNTYTVDDVTISNYHLLDEGTLMSHGWKPLIFADIPPDEEGYWWTPEYEEIEDQIIQSWVKIELPLPPGESIYTEAERLDFIEAWMEGSGYEPS